MPLSVFFVFQFMHKPITQNHVLTTKTLDSTEPPFAGSIIATLPLPLYNVYKTYKIGKSKYSTFKEIIRPLLPLSTLFVVSVIWAFCSKSDVLAQDPRAYYYVVGTVFSNIAVSFLTTCVPSKKEVTAVTVFDLFAHDVSSISLIR